jgi:acyl-CoA reductase-like NAD-dependent aldehyde dehydrogenase
MKIQSLISGATVASAQAGTVPLDSPVTLEAIGQLDDADAQVCRLAVEAAQAAYIAHRHAATAQRIQWLQDAAARMEACAAEIAALIVTDIGKPRRAALFEVGRAVQFVRACAVQLQTLGGEVLPLDATPAGAGHLGFTRRVPYGVVVAVTPFNAPANLLIQKVAPALAAGNAVVVKPHPAGTRAALAIATAFTEAGLPAGLFNVVTGDRAPVGELVAHPLVRAVTFTGGTLAGEAIARAAGAKKFIAELGSNAANVVLADADLADAAKRIAAAGFEASGQQCVSAQRVIVDARVYDAFLELFVTAARALKVGPPDAADTDVGPMVSLAAAERVMAMAHDAIARGARYALEPVRSGCIVSPGILVDAPRDSTIWTGEVFGPLVVVQRAQDADDALRAANDSPFGLQGAVFTRDLGAALRFADEFDVGAMWVNEASRFRLDTYPFGGVKQSGYGREGVRYAIEELTQLKFIGIRPV